MGSSMKKRLTFEGLVCQGYKKIRGKIWKSQLRKLTRGFRCTERPHWKLFFFKKKKNSAVKVDFVLETHHYCTAAWHAKGSSVVHRHRKRRTQEEREPVRARSPPPVQALHWMRCWEVLSCVMTGLRMWSPVPGLAHMTWQCSGVH